MLDKNAPCASPVVSYNSCLTCMQALAITVNLMQSISSHSLGQSKALLSSAELGIQALGHFTYYLESSVIDAFEPSAGPPGSATGPADTHQKFMAALAKAALAQVDFYTHLHTVCHVGHFALTSRKVCRLQRCKAPCTASSLCWLR